jgi:hypothetical protein
MAVAAVAGALAVGANATAQQTGTLVVRLVTNPAPPGATWKTEHTVALQPGAYQLRETGGLAARRP